MKGTIKLLSVLMIAILLVTVTVPVFATDYGPLISAIDSSGKGTDTSTDGIRDMAGKIVKWIRNVAVIAGVLLLTILGLKYMLGSAEEKADYKKSLVPLVVGIVVVMAAAQIMTMIFGFLD